MTEIDIKSLNHRNRYKFIKLEIEIDSSKHKYRRRLKFKYFENSEMKVVKFEKVKD